jgi:hypothetical protein
VVRWETSPFSGTRLAARPDMPSIHSQVLLDVGLDVAWDEVRKVGEVHKLFAPVLADSRVHGETRTVRFADGKIVHERILDLDDARRRVSYTATDVPGMTYHHASMQIADAGPGRCLFIWITDYLPAEMGAAIAPLVEQGTKALKANLERVPSR